MGDKFEKQHVDEITDLLKKLEISSEHHEISDAELEKFLTEMREIANKLNENPDEWEVELRKIFDDSELEDDDEDCYQDSVSIVGKIIQEKTTNYKIKFSGKYILKLLNLKIEYEKREVLMDRNAEDLAEDKPKIETQV